MCGILGCWQYENNKSQLENSIKIMTEKLIHRGPDDDGTFIDHNNAIGLGHRRLSILELSNAGKQPMLTNNKNLVLIFNGEIYNHMEIRRMLAKGGMSINWKGSSDTETLLNAIECWGLETTLPKLVGMFAFAVWDKKLKELSIARDRFGEKPLYFGWTGKGNSRSFVFASELKAIQSHPDFDLAISSFSLKQYLRYSYVPSPLSIYDDIYKLRSGFYLKIKSPRKPNNFSIFSQNNSNKYLFNLKQWWSLGDVVNTSTKKPIYSKQDTIDRLEEELKRTIEEQSFADVPVGAFLSGGIDSSLIVALMKKVLSRPVKTFTIGFNEAAYDESRHAKQVAQELGTDHHEVILSPEDAKDAIYKLPKIYDEPFADSSQIPTYLVCQLARETVKVALTGDGGDEVFGGYNRHIFGPRVYRTLKLLPKSIRNHLGKIFLKTPITAFNHIEQYYNAIFRKVQISGLGEKLKRLGVRLQSIESIEQFYLNISSELQGPESLLLLESNDYSDFSILDQISIPNKGLNSAGLKMMFFDTTTYLSDDILCKVDRASMANSLETRAPFLDHKIVEAAWQIPENFKINKGVGKWVLRQILYKYVSRELIERPKQGFSIPLNLWLRGPLRDWAEELVDRKKLHEQGFFNVDLIRKKWEFHLNGTYDFSSSLWSVLMFQSWYQEHCEG